MTPVDLATNTAGTPISVGSEPSENITVAPDQAPTGCLHGTPRGPGQPPPPSTPRPRARRWARSPPTAGTSVTGHGDHHLGHHQAHLRRLGHLPGDPDRDQHPGDLDGPDLQRPDGVEQRGPLGHGHPGGCPPAGYDLAGSDGGVFVFPVGQPRASSARSPASGSTWATSWASCPPTT